MTAVWGVITALGRADLDFRPVVRDAGTFLLVAKHIQEICDMNNNETLEGKVPDVAFYECSFFRLWCPSPSPPPPREMPCAPTPARTSQVRC